MAHVGKLYPVHFRRDFNLDMQTNRTGLAKGYALTSTSAFGTVGQAIVGKRFVCIAEDEDTLTGARWASSPMLVGGRHVHILLICDAAEVNAGIVARGQLIDSSAGSIGQFAIGRPSNHQLTNLNYGWDVHYFPQPSLFLPNNNSFGSLSAIFWPEWNNL